MTSTDQKPPPRTDMSAITEVLEYANAINCKSAFQPTIDAARAELADLRLKAADRNEWQDAATKVSAERDKLQQSLNLMTTDAINLRTQLAQLKQELALERASKVQAIHESTSKLQ